MDHLEGAALPEYIGEVGLALEQHLNHRYDATEKCLMFGFKRTRTDMKPEIAKPLASPLPLVDTRPANGVIDYNFDQVSVLGRSLYINGWCRDASPRVFLDNKPLRFLMDRIKRPDVAACFSDPQAEDWGFTLVCLVPEGGVDVTKLAIQLRDDVILFNPVKGHAALEDVAATSMIDRFIATVQQDKGSLLEIGSRARSGNSYRSFFPDDIDYVGLDVTDGPNVDIVGDAHEMSSILDRQFDYIFSISVFEHILMPWKVAIEMAKVLKPGGIGYIQSHSAFPLHDEPWDFWRFSKDAWKAIFNRHTGFEVVDAQYRYPANIVPVHINEPDRAGVSSRMNFLVSACLVKKIAEPSVEWSGRASEVFDLQYNLQDE